MKTKEQIASIINDLRQNAQVTGSAADKLSMLDAADALVQLLGDNIRLKKPAWLQSSARISALEQAELALGAQLRAARDSGDELAISAFRISSLMIGSMLDEIKESKS